MLPAGHAARFDGLGGTPRVAGLLGAAALGNVLIAAVLARRGLGAGTALALAPAVFVLLGALLASRRSILVFAALGTGLTIPFLNNPLPLPIGKAIFFSDLLLLIAVGSWIAVRLLGDTERSRLPSTPILGWPFVLFSLAVITAALRGHLRYGENLIGIPLRLVLYAGIALVIAQLDARQVYRGLVVVFYSGTVWMFFNAVYFIAVGKSQTDQFALTTGGTRILAQGTAMFLSGALFLALLSLEIDTAARRRLLHLVIVGLTLFEIVLSFGRTTFAALALVLPILCVFFRHVRAALALLLPLCIPLLVLTAILLPRVTPQLGTTLIERVTKSPSRDGSFQWRVGAQAAVWQQVKESPLIGVGFGRQTSFTFEQFDKHGFPIARIQEVIGQDAHNSFLWLLAGGGIACFGSFVLLLLVFTWDAWRRARDAVDKYDRLVVVWAGATLFVFLVNALTGPVLGNPILLLVIWTMLLLPSVSPKRRRHSASPA